MEIAIVKGGDPSSLVNSSKDETPHKLLLKSPKYQLSPLVHVFFIFVVFWLNNLTDKNNLYNLGTT